MRDAFGGLINIVIIVVFLCIVSGYLAFNVNYTKAFRVKNKIISTIEQYEGNIDNSEARSKMNDYMRKLGYNQSVRLRIPDYTCRDGYCYKVTCNRSVSSVNENRATMTVNVITQIQIDIPIINKIMPGLRMFQITGDTKAIKLTGSNRKYCS